MMHLRADRINNVIRKQSPKVNISTWIIGLFVIFAAVSVEVAVVRKWEM
jgi:hypothetical protein